MDAEQALKIVDHLLIAVVKARSNAMEAIAGKNKPDEAEMFVLQTTAPLLFPPPGAKLDLLDIIQHVKAITDNTKTVEPGTVYNLLFLAHREPALAITYGMIWEEELPEPMWAFEKDDLKARAKAALKAAGLED